MNNSTINLTNNYTDSLFITRVALLDYKFDITGEIKYLEINYNLKDSPHGFFIFDDVNNNVFDVFPLVSGEFIEIAIISKENEEQVFARTYIITNVEILSKNLRIENSKNKYKVYFKSISKFFNDIKMFSRGYEGVYSISEIVEKIIQEYVKNDIEEIDYYIEPTKNTLTNFVIPYSHPFDVINKLKKIASSKENNDIYLFYENQYSLNFISVSKLFSYYPKRFLKKQNSIDFMSKIPLIMVKEESFITGSSISNSLLNKGLGSTYMYFDNDKKDVVVEKFNLDEEYLNDIVTISNNSYYKKEFYELAKDSNINMMPKNSEYSKNYAMYDIRKDMFNNLRLKVSASGTLDIVAGNIIYIEFINNSNKLNLAFTGSWIVTDYKLIYTPNNEYTKSDFKPSIKTEIIISKDGYGTLYRDVIEKTNLIKTTMNINNSINNGE